MIRILVVLLLSFAALPALAQSFDCIEAVTSIEQAICSDSELAELDETLAETYRSIRDSLPAEHRENATAMQRLWLRSRNRRCQDDPYSVARCLKTVYQEWLSSARSGILYAEVALESGEPHLSPLVENWRFQYDEIDEEPEYAQRRYSAELRLFVGDQEHLLASSDDNMMDHSTSYERTLFNAVGYFLTPSGHIHVGYIQHRSSRGGRCGGYDRRVLVFLNPHTDPPQEIHPFVLSSYSECYRSREGTRTVSATEDGALEFMVPQPGRSSSSFTTPQMTRIDSDAGTVEEYIRVDTSTSHFEGETYEDLVARMSAALQVQESYSSNSALNDCGVPIRATHNYRSLMVGSIPYSLIDEGRPFGFQQLQHYVFNVLAPEHLESVGHYKPFVDGTLRYLDGMQEFEDWESRLSDAAFHYPGGMPGVSEFDVANWPSNPFIEAGFPTDACFAGEQSIWGPVDLEEWIYLFWARRLAEGNLEVTENLLRRISAMMD